MSDLVRQFLEAKDEDLSKYIPKQYDLTED